MRQRLFLLALFSSVACSASGPVAEDGAATASSLTDIVDLDAYAATSAAPVKTEVPVDAPAMLARAAHVVWGFDDAEMEDAPQKTYALDATGNVIAALDGAYVIAAGKTYRWDVEKVTVARMACAQISGELDDVEPEFKEHLLAMAADEKSELEREPTAEIERASFVDVATGARTVVATFGENDGLRDVSFNAELTGNVGSVVFVREKTWGYACGAHGNHHTTARTIDLALGAEETDLALDGDVIAEAEKVVAPSFTQRRAEWGGGVGFWEDGHVDETQFVEMIPEYEADGSLAMSGRFVTFAPYAFSDDWAGYGMAATARFTKLPAKLASAATAPEAVRTFMRAHPTFQLRGTSAR